MKRLKATGIVWRIDDLGRVAIPKEIRRTLKIREGDPLEIFVGRDGEVILKILPLPLPGPSPREAGSPGAVNPDKHQRRRKEGKP